MNEHSDWWSKERHQQVAEMLSTESDRGCAIFSAAILHDDLEFVLRAYFRSDEHAVKKVVSPLFAPYAPLSTLASRIDIAYSIGLITRTVYDDLHLVRRIRNDFAHEAGPIDFADPRCRDRVAAFTIQAKAMLDKGLAADTQPRIALPPLAIRFAFVMSVAGVSAAIREFHNLRLQGLPIRIATGAETPPARTSTAGDKPSRSASDSARGTRRRTKG
jgi:DNA-binding MltR family transcriptional regulator